MEEHRNREQKSMISDIHHGVNETCPSEILHSIEWWFLTDISGQPVGSIFKGQAVQEGDGTDRFSQKSVRNYHSTLHRIPKENRSQQTKFTPQSRNLNNRRHAQYRNMDVS
jgi:hypothetical protein